MAAIVKCDTLGSEQIGMTALARVAGDVAHTVDARDAVAAAAGTGPTR